MSRSTNHRTHCLEWSQFCFFVVPADETIRFLGQSILYHGIENGHGSMRNTLTAPLTLDLLGGYSWWTAPIASNRWNKVQSAATITIIRSSGWLWTRAHFALSRNEGKRYSRKKFRIFGTAPLVMSWSANSPPRPCPIGRSRTSTLDFRFFSMSRRNIMEYPMDQENWRWNRSRHPDHANVPPAKAC